MYLLSITTCYIILVTHYWLPHWRYVCFHQSALQFKLLFVCYMLHSLPLTTACRTFLNLLPHAVKFFLCCRIPYGLSFVAACCTVLYLLLQPYDLSVAICCSMSYSLLFAAACLAICCCNAAYRSVCYFLAACRTVCYLLLHAVQFAICCCMPYSLLFVSTYRAILLSLPHAVQLAFAATCHTVCYLLAHAVQSAIYCCMVYSSLLVIACSTIEYSLQQAIQFPICCHSLLFAAACYTVCCLL